ncbi:MAG: caspase family protein [Proteobacteria bacterium]|nr:caspase family protein [Pseudomonadota bacterium]
MPNYYGFCVGINYIGTENQLAGCVDDIEDMAKLMQASGVPAKNIQMFSDAYKGAAVQPTRDNIINGLKALVAKAQPDDIIFFHYSGHGTNSLRRKNDYEAICPIKDKEIELIADFELHAIINELVPGARFVSALDCCHSGDMFNLEFNVGEKSKLTHYDRGVSVAKEDVKSKAKAAGKKPPHAAPEKPVVATKPHGYVVVVSGCEIKQTSADAEQDGRPQGAFTACLKDLIKEHGFHYILDILLSGSKQQMQGLDTQMRAWMKTNRYSQLPDIAFEGQLAAMSRDLMMKKGPQAPAKAGELITDDEARPLLMQFAKFMRDAQRPAAQVVSATAVEARNDEMLQLPERRKGVAARK